MAKKKLTMAARAKAIQSKYKGRENDEMAIESMERELNALMQEQEAYKAKNNMNNDTPEFQTGGGLNKNQPDYNTFFPQKTTEGSSYWLTPTSVAVSKNEAYKPFNDRFSYTRDSTQVPDFGNIRGVDIDSVDGKTNLFFAADNKGDTGKMRKAVSGELTDEQLDFGNFMPKKANGGSLKKYQDGGGFSYPMERNDSFGFRMNPYEAQVYGEQYQNPQQLSMGKRQVSGADNNIAMSNEMYSPSYNWMSPALSSGTNILSNYLGSKGKQQQKDNLLRQQEGLYLGRVSPTKVDYGRERADIASLRDLVAASGRTASRGASSAAERANIENAALLGAQRTAGSQLGQSFSREEGQNAQYRNQAEMYNAQMRAREAEIKNRNRMMIEQQYGDPSQDWLPQTIKSTGQSFTNAYDEQRRAKEHYDYLNMLSENYYLDKNKKLTSRR